MKIEKLNDTEVKVIYETPEDIEFIKGINNERKQLKTIIKSLKREIKILKEEKDG